ncbi:MAG: sugar ABC transporter permease [Clostridia bacterium]|nr:sugar ABC transporter permease [Clostridia bacterium]
MTNANEKLVKAAPKKRRRGASLDKRKARMGYLFVLPFIIGLVAIYLPIIYDSILYSFTNIKHGADGYQLMWVGLKNYQDALFVDTSYVQILTSGITQLFLDIPCIIIFSLFMAVLLNQKMVGRAAFRAIFFVPVILSTGLVAKIDMGNELLSYMQNTDEGISTGAQSTGASEIVSAMDFKYLFSSMKVGTQLVDYVINAINNIYNIVNRSGVQMLIFLSGLQSISPAIYESCQIEGASAWETFWKITFPMISPMILVNAVYTIIDAFTSSTNTVMSYINDVYTKTDGDVLSSAMAWMYFLIVILIIAVVAGIMSTFVFYQRRD